jgi:protein-S-isoprenylcysteine O-methyltransferase Ste14
MNKSIPRLGQRGEGYVVLQLGLFALMLFGPRQGPDWLIAPWPEVFQWAAHLLLLLAGGLLVSGAVFLGRRNLTPLPYPKPNAELVQHGPYRWVRHPIYSGLIFFAFGYALRVQGELNLLYALLWLGFFDLKSRREEIWLAQKFSNYYQYQTRVAKLIPGVY